MDKLQDLALDERQQAYLSISESNLDDIRSALSRRFSTDYNSLTPFEGNAANFFIRQDKKSREIDSLLGFSPRIVGTYQSNTRK